MMRRLGGRTENTMNFESLKQTLPIMGKGMLGIFAVTIVIICTIWLLNKLSSKSK